MPGLPASDYEYDIVLLGFRDLSTEQAVQSLQTTFGIGRVHASKMISRLPMIIKKHANDEDAQRYIRSLLRLGAEVKVINGPFQRVYLPEDLLILDPSSPSGLAPNQSLADGVKPTTPEPAGERPSPVFDSSEFVPQVKGPQLETAICPQCALEQTKTERCGQCGAVLEWDPYDLIRQHTQSPEIVEDDGFEDFDQDFDSSPGNLDGNPTQEFDSGALLDEDENPTRPTEVDFSGAQPLFESASFPSEAVTPASGVMAISEPHQQPAREPVEPMGPETPLRPTPETGAQPALESSSQRAATNRSADFNRSAIGGAPFVLSADDDDGLFSAGRRFFDPAGMLEGQGFSGAYTGLSTKTITGEQARVQGNGQRTESGNPLGGAALVSVGTDRGFWDKLPRAFSFPLKGPGFFWFALFFVLSAVASLALIVFIPLQGLFVKMASMLMYLVCSAALMATCWRYFSGIFSDSVTGNETVPHSVSDIEHFASEYVFPGLQLLFSTLLLCFPAIGIGLATSDQSFAGFIEFLGSPLGLILTLIPIIYWPFGLCLVTFSGKLNDFLDVRSALDSALVGQREGAFAAALTVVPAVVFLMLLPSIVDGGAWWASALWCLAICYLTGVQAYLFGKLYRRRPAFLDTTAAE